MTYIYIRIQYVHSYYNFILHRSYRYSELCTKSFLYLYFSTFSPPTKCPFCTKVSVRNSEITMESLGRSMSWRASVKDMGITRQRVFISCVVKEVYTYVKKRILTPMFFIYVLNRSNHYNFTLFYLVASFFNSEAQSCFR